MPVLKSLSFTSVPKRSNDPIILRRAKIVGKLEEQLAIHKDPTYIRESKRWKEVDGVRQLVTIQQRIAPWWRTDAVGHTVFFIKYGSKPIEFEKGKAGISVSSKDKLPNLIESLIAAVRNGELDEILTAVSGHRPFVKKKAN